MSWSSLFAMHVPATELILRGTLTYWFIFLAFRFVMRRNAGAPGLADVLLLVIIADAAQNGMAGSYDSVAEGCVLVSTILAWNLLVDVLAYHYPAVARFAEPPPLTLVRDGRILHANLRREYVTVDELMAQLRLQGIDDLGIVRIASMEADGKVSVIRFPQPENNSRPANAATSAAPR